VFDARLKERRGVVSPRRKESIAEGGLMTVRMMTMTTISISNDER